MFLFLLANLFAGLILAQTVIYHENFEQPSLGDSVVSSGNPGWALSTKLHNGGLRSDSSRVAVNDSTFLTTTAFSTVGNYFVMLQFSHICKIEFFDNAIIQVSNNNGTTWTQLVAAQYLGSGQFGSNGNKFTSTSYVDWLPGTASAVPTDAWWKTEQFDISSLVGNSSQVKIRFKLSDGNGTGSSGNYGWLIDDIKVTMNFSEMNPPVITLLPPNYSGTVYSTGPFTVKAKIIDASGIDTSKIFYTINSGAVNAVGMTILSADTFRGYIPAVNSLDTICYYVYAQDNSPNHNSTQAPSSGCISFVASSGITFPFFDNFDGFNNWTATTTSPGTSWELGTPNYGVTNSAYSAPNAWDVNLTTAYGSAAHCTLTSPVFNFSSAVNAKLTFWQNRNCENNYDGTRLEYTTNGTTWQVLGIMNDPNAVNWYTNTSIYSSSLPAWDGNSGGWVKSEYLLNLLNNTSGPVQFRFIFTSDASVNDDGFSIDDFSIVLPAPQEAAMVSVLEPIPGCGLGNETVKVKIVNMGMDSINGGLTASYKLTGGSLTVTENVPGIILPGDSLDFTFAAPVDIAVTSADSTFEIVTWINLVGDPIHTNDTAKKNILSGYIPPAPVSSGITIPYGTSATLTATSSDSLYWFSVPSGGTQIGTGSTYITPVLYYTTIYYVEARTGCPSNRVQDTVFVTGVPPCDMSVQAIHTPNSGIELTNHELVKVRVKNYGTSAAVKVPIHYVINGGTPVNDTVQGPIATNDTAVFTFATAADLSAFTTYNLTVYTDLACDATLANDTTHKTVVCSPLVYCTSIPDYTADEEIYSVTVNGATNAYDCLTVAPGPGSILNRYSNFTTLPPLTSLSQGATIPFTILEDECDGASYYSNGCAIWIDLNRDGDFTDSGEEVFVENTTTQSPRTINGAFTIPVGSYNGVTAMRIIVAESNSGASLTPCMTYYYGETEDYNVIISPQIPHDAGVINILKPTVLETEGASIPVKVIVKNFGSDTIFNSSNMYVDYQLNGGTAINTLWNLDTLLPSAIDTIDLSNMIVPLGNNNICAYTVLAGDSNTFNDKTCLQFYGLPLQDGGVTSINQPGAMSQAGSSAIVQVTVKNFGANPITNMSVAYKINSGTPVSQSWSGSLNPGTTTIVTLPSFTVPPATFNICAYTMLIGDGDHSNDTLCKSSFGIFKDTLSYYDNFDGAIVAWFDQSTSTDTKWELGTPGYGVTNSAYSAPNAWDINLTTAYNSSANSILYTQLFDFSNAVNAKMKFWQNRNCETNYDGTRLEYSINGGTTWLVLGVMNDPNGVNWYTDNSIYSSSKAAWEGNSNGWQKSEYKLSILNGKPNVQFRFIFTSDGYGNYDGFSIDDFSITLTQHIDAGVTEIISPLTQTTAGSTVHVKVKLKNFGSDTLTSIPVSYKINNSATFSSTWSGVLHPNDTTSFVFPQTFTSLSGQYSLCAYTGLANDGDHMNDTTCSIIGGVPVFYVTYTDNFENLNYWISADGNSSWERGAPSSGVINTAHSPVNVWKTNLDGNYSDNSNDNLYSPKLNLSFVLDTAVLSFWHWYETQSSYDGGNVQYSINGGQTWLTLGYQGDTYATNWYNSMINGNPGWSGSSGGWQKSMYKIVKSPQFNNFTSLIQLCFHFFSNVSNSNYNGWAIDDFCVSVPQIPIDGSVSAILEPSAPTVMAASTAVKVKIKNLGTSALSNIPVFYKVDNNTPVSGNWTGTLQPDSTIDYIFASAYNSPVIQYKLCAYTDITNDLYYYNDTSCVFMFPAPPPIDAGIGLIVTPGISTPAGSAVTVTAKLVNYGTDTLTSADVSYQVNLGPPTIQLWTGTLPPGDSTDFTFSSVFNAPVSQYNLCVYTTCNGDPNPYNDEYCKNVQTGAGIEAAANNGLYLGQNIPNPANNLTTIEYYVQGNGEAVFSVMNSIGQLIYTESKKVDAGFHLVKLDITRINAGIYYYTLEFNGSRLYKKMVIAK